MRTILNITVLFFLVNLSCRNNNQENTEIKIIPPDNLGWTYADSLRKTIQLPVIPDNTFPVNAASGLASIQNAIDKADENGGGTVRILKGIHLSYPLQLKSNVHLQVDNGAILRFISDPEQYPLVYTWFDGIPCMNYSPMIYANGQVNIKISGEGIIDGQGDKPVWKNMKYREEIDWDLLEDMEDEGVEPEHRKFGKEHSLRPDLIAFVSCKIIEIKGVTIINSPYWTIHPILCEDLIINNLHIKSSGYDQIGIAPESSSNIIIENVNIAETEDGIKIKSGRVKDTSLKPSQNIIIHNIVIKNITDEAIAIGSKIRGGVSRVFISGISIVGAKRGFTIIADAELKGIIREIYIKDIQAYNIEGSFIQCGISNSSSDYRKSILYNLYFDNLTVDSCGQAFIIAGYRKQPIQNVSVINSSFLSFRGSLAKNVRNLNLSNVSDANMNYNKRFDVEDIKSDKLDIEKDDNDILDTDDIAYDDLNELVKKNIHTLYPHIPIENIERIITKTSVNYEIEFELENSMNLGLLISSQGEILQSVEVIPFNKLPVQVLATLRSSIKTEPVPFIIDEIKKISVKDFTYFEIKGETRALLFLAGISEDGSIIEEKQKQIKSLRQAIEQRNHSW